MRRLWINFRRFTRAIKHAAIYRLSGRPLVAPKMIRANRMATCFDCDHYGKGGLCKLCNCLLVAKTMLASESCPDTPPRWRSLESTTRESLIQEDGDSAHGEPPEE